MLTSLTKGCDKVSLQRVAGRVAVDLRGRRRAGGDGDVSDACDVSDLTGGRSLSQGRSVRRRGRWGG